MTPRYTLRLLGGFSFTIDDGVGSRLAGTVPGRDTVLWEQALCIGQPTLY